MLYLVLYDWTQQLMCRLLLTENIYFLCNANHAKHKIGVYMCVLSKVYVPSSLREPESALSDSLHPPIPLAES